MVRAYNGLTETHRGSVTADIVVGANPTIVVTLVPLVGDVLINVSIGTTIVIVRPGVATLGVGSLAFVVKTLKTSSTRRRTDPPQRTKWK